MNNLPLLNLFIRLREEAGLPLGIDDYLSLIRALQLGFGISNLNALAQLCRSLWIRSEAEERIFNAYFEQMIDTIKFKPKDSFLLRQLLQRVISQEKPLYEDNVLVQDHLKILSSRERNILSMLNGLDDGRKKTPSEVGKRLNLSYQQIIEIETEAMQKLNRLNLLLATENQKLAVMRSALRVVDDVQLNKLVQDSFTGGDEEVPYGQLSKSIEYFPVTRRQMIQTWRYLRRPVRQGTSAELDIEATINQIGLQGMFLEPVLVPYRINRAELLLLVDRDGSMVPFHELSRRLAQTASQEGRLGKINIYYFRNCPSDFIYRDPYLLEAETLKNVFSNLQSERSTVLIFSDGGAARGNYNRDRIQLTKQFLDELRRYTHSIAWLNPMPRFRWGGTSANQIERMIPMFEFNRRGLQSAVSLLSKRSKTTKVI
ncbi:sigma factor-like helix-turn-helix DNA-binding protein [Nostoc sp.]|uniref:sigma factor-like helix-turn-helix DNA-binding protein n=1 Tax=Nostoc sp. TaxID=1180 RepID=UPI002FF6424D